MADATRSVGCGLTSVQFDIAHGAIIQPSNFDTIKTATNEVTIDKSSTLTSGTQMFKPAFRGMPLTRTSPIDIPPFIEREELIGIIDNLREYRQARIDRQKKLDDDETSEDEENLDDQESTNGQEISDGQENPDSQENPDGQEIPDGQENSGGQENSDGHERQNQEFPASVSSCAIGSWSTEDGLSGAAANNNNFVPICLKPGQLHVEVDDIDEQNDFGEQNVFDADYILRTSYSVSKSYPITPRKTLSPVSSPFPGPDTPIGQRIQRVYKSASAPQRYRLRKSFRTEREKIEDTMLDLKQQQHALQHDTLLTIPDLLKETVLAMEAEYIDPQLANDALAMESEQACPPNTPAEFQGSSTSAPDFGGRSDSLTSEEALALEAAKKAAGQHIYLHCGEHYQYINDCRDAFRTQAASVW